MHDFDNAGVIPRVLNDLFAHIDQETTIRFCVRVSFIEIYNEDMKDLFAKRTPGVTAKLLKISAEKNSIRVDNLLEVRIYIL